MSYYPDGNNHQVVNPTYIPPANTKSPVQVAYVCNGKACVDGCNNPECHHVCDISHAKNFEHVGDDKYIEKEVRQVMVENLKRVNIDRCVDMAIELFDHSNQDLILIEAMSELTKALLKLRRGKSAMDDVTEEMTHVLISVEVVRRILDIADVDLEKEACKKLEKYGYSPKLLIVDEDLIEAEGT